MGDEKKNESIDLCTDHCASERLALVYTPSDALPVCYDGEGHRSMNWGMEPAQEGSCPRALLSGLKEKTAVSHLGHLTPVIALNIFQTGAASIRW